MFRGMLRTDEAMIKALHAYSSLAKPESLG